MTLRFEVGASSLDARRGKAEIMSIRSVADLQGDRRRGHVRLDREIHAVPKPDD